MIVISCPLRFVIGVLSLLYCSCFKNKVSKTKRLYEHNDVSYTVSPH